MQTFSSWFVFFNMLLLFLIKKEHCKALKGSVRADYCRINIQTSSQITLMTLVLRYQIQ